VISTVAVPPALLRLKAQIALYALIALTLDGGAADTLPSANVYQNSAQLSDSTIAFVNSLAGTTTVAENSLVGGAEPTYVGVGSFSVPNYQIQYGTNRCLDVASVRRGAY